jgi:hypothetical protein
MISNGGWKKSDTSGRALAHENVERPEFGLHLLKHRRDLCRVGHVGPDEHAVRSTGRSCASVSLAAASFWY